MIKVKVDTEFAQKCLKCTRFCKVSATCYKLLAVVAW
jgi:hypothetical protein